MSFYSICPVALPHGAVGWSAVVIVVFPNHSTFTQLLFEKYTLKISVSPGHRKGNFQNISSEQKSDPYLFFHVYIYILAHLAY